jgi:hypothetical protein
MLPQKRLLSFLLLALVCVLPLSARADKDETDLDKIMSKLNGAVRRINKQLADPAKNPDTLKDVAIAKEQAELAKKQTPALAAEKEDKAKFVADYQKQIDLLIAQLGQLETAVKANDNAAARDVLKKMNDLKKSGHKEFKKPDKE